MLRVDGKFLKNSGYVSEPICDSVIEKNVREAERLRSQVKIYGEIIDTLFLVRLKRDM